MAFVFAKIGFMTMKESVFCAHLPQWAAIHAQIKVCASLARMKVISIRVLSKESVFVLRDGFQMAVTVKNALLKLMDA